MKFCLEGAYSAMVYMNIISYYNNHGKCIL